MVCLLSFPFLSSPPPSSFFFFPINLLISRNLRSFHEEFPEQLVKLQDAHWKPLIAWVSKTFDVEIQIYEGILGTKQPLDTITKLGIIADGYDQYKLAGMY